MKSDTKEKVNQPNSSKNSEIRSLNTPIKVMVHNRHLLFLECFSEYLHKWGFQVTAAVPNILALEEAISLHGLPDIILLDYYNDTYFPLTIIKRIKEDFPSVKLIITNDPDPHKVVPIEVINRLGIVGVVDIQYHTLEQVKHGIIRVYKGGTFFDKGQKVLE
jgi:DNA-binding NarL/FixJ family response regulator